MSYNVDSWKTKKLKNLRIPLTSFVKHPRKDWHPEKILNEDGTVTIECMESTIIGTVTDDVLTVKELHINGEGSGTFLNWIFEPALADSTGELVAVRIWEGGDSIDRLTVKDGAVSSEAVEL